MFLVASVPWYSALMWFAVVAALMLANEIARASKWASRAMFVALPVVLTVFVWPTTAGRDSSTGTWFHWVKVYSALAGVLGFMCCASAAGSPPAGTRSCFRPRSSV